MPCSPYLDDGRRPLTTLERELCAALLELRDLAASGSEQMAIIDRALAPTTLNPGTNGGARHGAVDWRRVRTNRQES
jgi:hypothetical protein